MAPLLLQHPIEARGFQDEDMEKTDQGRRFAI